MPKQTHSVTQIHAYCVNCERKHRVDSLDFDQISFYRDRCCQVFVIVVKIERMCEGRLPQTFYGCMCVCVYVCCGIVALIDISRIM